MLLRRPDRFLSVDSSVFLDPSVTSTEYVRRYSLLHDEASVLARFGAEDEEGLEDPLQFEGSVHFHPEGVELRMATEGILLVYPFVAAELHALSGEMDPG